MQKVKLICVNGIHAAAATLLTSTIKPIELPPWIILSLIHISWDDDLVHTDCLVLVVIDLGSDERLAE